MDKLDDMAMAALMLVFAIIGIVGIIGFLTTLMWHCLFFAVVSTCLICAWYNEDYKSKGRSIRTLWQRKNTKN